ncbi:hypothetical protein KFE25_003292 [Diacronema lutheri]|uniref:Calcineurin-like phosphoesterase domain-containing protein n=1 Tax=Diacronema lutheri TaxID=2081491 RepID=A0A8J6C954_DIALT|nr:hypothetical protein KFE25_003292 [Diacronema lutheri]
MARRRLALALALLVTVGRADEEWSTVWAIGDLHGDAACARYWVSRTGLIAELDGPSSGWTWTDPTAALVFVGDYIDKGPEARAVLEFVRALTRRFARHVHAIMGNHELNLLADREKESGLTGAGAYRYLELAWGAAHPGQYASWLPPAERESADGKAALRSLLDALADVYAARKHGDTLLAAPAPEGDGRGDRGRGGGPGEGPGEGGEADQPRADASILRWIPDRDARALAARELSRWQAAYLAGVASGSELGTWLEQRPLTVVLGGTLFVHGGIAASLVAGPGAPLGSQAALRALNAELGARSAHGRLGALLAERTVVHELVEFRGLHGDCAQVAAVAAALNVSRIAVGHTPANDVRVSCGGALLALDSALGRWFRGSGNNYCDGETEARSRRGGLICPRKAAGCHGQIVRLGREAKGASGAWRVHVVPSDDHDGELAARWAAVGAASARADEAADAAAATAGAGAASASRRSRADEL